MNILTPIMNAWQHAGPIQQALWIPAVLGACLGLAAAIIRLVNVILDYRRLRRAEKLQTKMNLGNQVSAFTREEIRDGIRHYIVPDCAQTDPSNHSDLRRTVPVREAVLVAVSRFIEQGGEYRFILLLADTGMGKTTFCLNYFSYLERGKSGLSCVLIPLGRPGAVERIRRIENPAETVLILDAFDEDVQAIDDSGARMQALMAAAADFRGVIITCRSQFFENDAAVPTSTGVSVVRPRRAGEVGEYRFYRIYLLPFSSVQVEKYLKVEFPWWSASGLAGRRAAKRVVEDIPELSVRPMLLALVPDLVKSKEKIEELFDLYKFMIDKWIERESSWIEPEILLSVSKKLSIFIYSARKSRKTDRVTLHELHILAEQLGVPREVWTHLSSRSLLNRDSEGNFKFSHRSIMEYLFVISAIEGNEECFKTYWSDFMRDLLVSWGNADVGRRNIARANEILSMDLQRLGLAPLSDRLEAPRVVGAGTYLAPSKSISDRRVRKIPQEWRKTSLRMRDFGTAQWVFDYEYGLCWRITDTSLIEDWSVINLNLVELSKINPRLPSKDEFMSLVEAEDILNMRMITRENFIWLGDFLGHHRPVAASISEKPIPHDAAKVLGKIDIGVGLGGAVWFYEILNKPAQFGARLIPFSAEMIGMEEMQPENYVSPAADMTPEQLESYLFDLRSFPDTGEIV